MGQCVDDSELTALGRKEISEGGKVVITWCRGQWEIYCVSSAYLSRWIIWLIGSLKQMRFLHNRPYSPDEIEDYRYVSFPFPFDLPDRRTLEPSIRS